MCDYEKLVEESEEGSLSETKADIIRVLVTNTGTSWESDLIQDLKSFRELTGREPSADRDDVENALLELKEEGFLNIEDRPKATKDGFEEDSLISLDDLEDARNSLSNDKALIKYNRAVSERYFETEDI